MIQSLLLIREFSTRPTFGRLSFFVLALALIASEISAQSFPFVIPGDDATISVTDRSVLLHKPAGSKGFVQSVEDHFVLAGQPIRFWGVNLCFGANFPTHAEADRLAPHLAKLGCNAVRFHHMDMQAAPNGIWDPTIVDGDRKLSSEMVDRLDYFLARLHEHGVYANMNLHVSRTLTEAEGYPQLAGDAPWWAGANKWVMYYDRDVQQELKDYCRDMLLHENPYRDNTRRVDDPGIALVEMLNENYFSEQGYDLYRKLPKRFQASFLAAWNRWLKARYETQSKMEAAWSRNQPALSEPLFPVASFASGLDRWELSKSNQEMPFEFGVRGPQDSGFSALRIAPKKIFEQDHEQQLRHPGLNIAANSPYTISFWVRSDKPREFRAELSTSAGGEWRQLGLFETLTANSEWQQVSRVVIPETDVSEGQASLVFTIGQNTVPVEFAGIEFRAGVAEQPLPEGQSLEQANLIIPEDGWPVAAHRDVRRFMVETETAWVSELKNYLTDDLGVQVPITASQINYHPAELVASQLDFVDLHNYWHHPIFPSGEDWNAEKWTIQNEPMEALPTRSNWPSNSLLTRTGWRFSNQPMTMSEWNYPEPSFYGAGCVPMAATLAALQDWDGVFFFDYDAFSRNDGPSQFFRNQTENYFSFNGQPVKLAIFSQMANVFLRGDLARLKDAAISDPENPIDGRFALSRRIGVSISADTATMPDPPAAERLASPDQSVVWNTRPDQAGDPLYGYLQINTPATKAVWGTIAEQSFTVGDLTIETGQIEPNYGFVILSTVDGSPLETAPKTVLTVASHSENIGMGWNEDRTSVGTDWGKGPTQVTMVPAKISMPIQAATATVYALDGTGTRQAEIESTVTEGRLTFKTKPSHKTLWYEISQQP
jgi:hypothetical protein